jgi:hypothetical protein
MGIVRCLMPGMQPVQDMALLVEEANLLNQIEKPAIPTGRMKVSLAPLPGFICLMPVPPLSASTEFCIPLLLLLQGLAAAWIPWRQGIGASCLLGCQAHLLKRGLLADCFLILCWQ